MLTSKYVNMKICIELPRLTGIDFAGYDNRFRVYVEHLRFMIQGLTVLRGCVQGLALRVRILHFNI